MKFNVIFSTLYCYCCAHFVQAAVINRLQGNNLQVIGVNRESQLEILDELDLYSLTMTAIANKKLTELADDVFKRKFARKAIGIFGPLSMDPRYSVHILDTIITNYNFEVFSLILKTFGHLIEKVVIGYDGITLDQRKDIHNLIFEYSRNLTSVELMEWDENVLKAFTNPLLAVDHLTLSGNLKTKSDGVFNFFDKNSLKLNEIFPNIRKLSLDRLWVTNPSILNVHFSQLDYVRITLLPAPFNHPLEYYFSKAKPAMEKLFEKNPQIRNLTIHNCNSLDYIRIVAENLPELEYFRVNFGRIEENYSGNQFHFENVKKLYMKIGNIDLSQIMTFGSVEEIRLECIERECNNFPFNTVSSLKKLFIVGYSEKILKLAENVPFLQEIFIVSESDIEASAMIRFIVGSKQLGKLILVSPFGQTLFDTITRHLSTEWKVTKNNFIFTLEKQNEL